MTALGVSISEQIVDFGTTIGSFWTTHLNCFTRIYNAGTVSPAMQLWINQTTIWQIDSIPAPYQNVQSGLGYGSLVSPTGSYVISSSTTIPQTALFSNSTAPVSATLSNTVGSYQTMGGLFNFAAPGGAETDYALFSSLIPPPYSFTCTGVKVSSYLSTGMINSGSALVLMWGLGFNSISQSLATAAPYSPQRKTMGIQTFVQNAPTGTQPADVSWSGMEVVQPGRYLHVILRIPQSTQAPLTSIRGCCNIEGYFE